MESYILLIIAFIVSAGSLYIGFRIGRASGRVERFTGTSGASRLVNSVSGPGSEVSSAELESTQRAIEGAIRTNEQTAEVIQKMRDILNKHNSSSNGNDIPAD